MFALFGEKYRGETHNTMFSKEHLCKKNENIANTLGGYIKSSKNENIRTLLLFYYLTY